jgi:hypothetical protein
LNYAEYVATIANETVISATDPNFVQILPQAITYAEQRLYRELDLLDTVTRDAAILNVRNRNFTLPQNNGRFVVTNGLNVITPAGTTTPDNGLRTPMLPVSRDFLDATWGSQDNAGLPTLYAPITDQLFIVGPWPDLAYTIEVIGTIRPTPLSASNTSTYLTLYLPDLFVAASMIFMAGYMRDFGSQADDPQMAQSWQGQYDKLFASANVEEQRKRYASGAWGSLSPTPIATPSR